MSKLELFIIMLWNFITSFFYYPFFILSISLQKELTDVCRDDAFCFFSCSLAIWWHMNNLFILCTIRYKKYYENRIENTHW